MKTSQWWSTMALALACAALLATGEPAFAQARVALMRDADAALEDGSSEGRLHPGRVAGSAVPSLSATMSMNADTARGR